MKLGIVQAFFRYCFQTFIPTRFYERKLMIFLWQPPTAFRRIFLHMCIKLIRVVIRLIFFVMNISNNSIDDTTRVLAPVFLTDSANERASIEWSQKATSRRVGGWRQLNDFWTESIFIKTFFVPILYRRGQNPSLIYVFSFRLSRAAMAPSIV